MHKAAHLLALVRHQRAENGLAALPKAVPQHLDRVDGPLAAVLADALEHTERRAVAGFVPRAAGLFEAHSAAARIRKRLAQRRRERDERVVARRADVHAVGTIVLCAARRHGLTRTRRCLKAGQRREWDRRVERHARVVLRRHLGRLGCLGWRLCTIRVWPHTRHMLWSVHARGRYPQATLGHSPAQRAEQHCGFSGCDELPNSGMAPTAPAQTTAPACTPPWLQHQCNASLDTHVDTTLVNRDTPLAQKVLRSLDVLVSTCARSSAPGALPAHR